MEENNREKSLNIVNELNSKFKEGILPNFTNYHAISKFRSIRRAIKRENVDLVTGVIYPKRPFNNRKPTLGRLRNETKKKIYGKIRRIQ